MDKTNNKKIAEWLGFKVVAGAVFLYEEERGWYRDGSLMEYVPSDGVDDGPISISVAA